MTGMLQLTAAAMLALAAHVSSQSQPGDELLFNQVQFVGTDQSHHQAPPQAVLDLLDQPLYQNAFANSSLDLPQGYFFSHLSITDQLNAGVRGFEFYVQQDNSTGGKFAYSAALKLANASCYLFTDCLQQIANWSAANPNHFPVSVFIHKGSSTPPQTTLGNAYGPALQQLQATNGEPMNFTTGTTANLTDVTAEILSVFNRSQMYTPDDLRADNNASSVAALRDIVFPNGALNGSWPTIGRLRNKILIMADPDYLTTISPLYPNATNTLFWFADDQGDTDPIVVVLDAYVDVALQNTSTPLPYALDDNADSL
eukprot:jgi/Astpho2/4302/Aster-x1214